ncbi:metal cation symporter ZIP8-like [Oppia nitens]|uniref:metal cation symporter ZIP8-like n=1 Tax=Oppia nitens TaxID=1686743 RepID=UPI0023D99412|nr:metal cation symporter ZIP8-like [Oppia nitens]
MNLIVDYPEEEHEEIHVNISSDGKSEREPILTTIKDVERMTRFILLRGHIILDPTHKIYLNESRVSRLIAYFHDIQLRKGSGRPLDDRDLGCDQFANKKKNSQELCQMVTSECLSSSEMLDLVPKSTMDFHQIIARLCPLILFQQTRPICYGDSHRTQHDEEDQTLQLVEPSIERVWGFGVLFVTLSIVVSMGGLIVLPFLNKNARRIILTLFEGLAVGGLAGSAILHLFPQAFDIVDDKYREYFWRTFLIFCGIYLFYIIEMCLKIITVFKSKSRRKRPSLGREEDKDVFIAQTLSQKQILSDSQPTTESFEMQRTQSNSGVQAVINSTREQLFQCLSTVNVMKPVSPNQYVSENNKTEQKTNPKKLDSKVNFVPGVRSQRFDQNSSQTITVDTVAWMIVLGDALLNFIDGLSIGAAFDRNILAGISISVAVMLEEVAHRLGTFAVLIRAGMKMKQSFLYILLCACACYPGLALGIFLGDEAEDASPYIFALAGGFFLYMALVDVMRAMNRSMENASRKGVNSMLQIWGLQNIGIILSVIFLGLLAFYEREMDFERVELEEIAEHSLE